MAHTITLFAHGTATLSAERFSSPAESRASRYFTSPAYPASIQCGKCFSSANSCTGATPASSKPASRENCFTMDVISEICKGGNPGELRVHPENPEKFNRTRDRACSKKYEAGKSLAAFISPAFSLPRCNTSYKGCPTPGCPREWSASGYRFWRAPRGRSSLPGSAGPPISFELPVESCYGLPQNRLRLFRRAHRSLRALPC